MTTPNRVLSALATALAVWGFPASALACSVCFSAKDEANRLAFIASTVFLTALPLVLMGAFIAWAARRAQALDAPSFDASDPASSDSGFEQAERLLGTASEPAAAEPSRVVPLPAAGSDRVPSP
jgi:hypothetical protein